MFKKSSKNQKITLIKKTFKYNNEGKHTIQKDQLKVELKGNSNIKYFVFIYFFNKQNADYQNNNFPCSFFSLLHI